MGKTSWKLDLDIKEFTENALKAKGTVEGISKIEGPTELIETLMKVGKIMGVLGTAALALKTSFDMTLEAEKLKQIENSFDAMAESVGVSAEKMKTGLLAATQGKLSESESLQVATRAMTTLGEQAERIPQIMMLARKATSVFGGELTSNFETFSMAIASGNTRMLRQFGIIIDNDKALSKYAKSLGVGVQYLDDQARKQAIATAALSQAEDKYKNLNTIALQATKAFSAFKVALEEASEKVSTLAATSTVWKKFFMGATEAVEGASLMLEEKFGTGAKAAELRVMTLTEKVEGLKTSYKNLMEAQEKSGDVLSIDMAARRKEIETLEAQLKAQETLAEALKMEEQEKAQRAAREANFEKAKKSIEEEGPGKGIDPKIQKDREKFYRDIDRLESDMAEQRKKRATEYEDYESAHTQQLLSIQMQTTSQISEIERQAAELGLSNDERIAMAKENIYTEMHAKIDALEKEREAMTIHILENQLTAATSLGQGIGGAFKLGAAESAKALTDWGATGKMVFGSFKQQSTSALLAFGAGTKSAGEAVKEMTFGVVADTAQAKGQEMMLSGIWPPNPAAIAGGAALISLAGFLRAKAGGNATMGGGEGGGGGGIGGGAEKPELQEAPKKAVTIQVMGSYFETEQTQRRR